MTGQLMPIPATQFLDNDGNIVPGGKLYSYAAGTTTPQNTYTTAALTVANANPIILDSAGRAVVFLDQSLSYKFVFKTAADVTLWTVDNTASTLTNGSVTLAMMANLAQDQFIGRVTASTGVPETATITAAARTVLDDTTVAAMVNTLGGASSSGTGGLVRLQSPTFTGQPVSVFGTSGTGLGNMIGVNLAYTVSTGSGAGVFQPLVVATLPANTFDAAGRGWRVTAWGKFANNANAKAVYVACGNPIGTIQIYGGNADNKAWWTQGTFVRMTSTTVSRSVIGMCDTATISSSAATAEGIYDFTAVTYIGAYCDATAANDVLQYGLLIELF